jgi:hypothetical protein
MTKQNLRPSNPVKGAAPARPRRTQGKRKPLTAASLGVLAGALLIAALSISAPWFSRDMSGELTTSKIDTHRLGAIYSDDGTTRCARATFDNRTGKISQGPAACETTMFVDGQHVPVPLGTAHTLNAISNSFK